MEIVDYQWLPMIIEVLIKMNISLSTGNMKKLILLLYR